MQTFALPALAVKNRAVRYFSCLRLQEVLVLQGSPLLGAAVALRGASIEAVNPLALLIVANACLVAHVFAVNDWANVAADLADRNKAPGVFTMRGVGPQEMALLAIGLLVVSVLLFGQFGRLTLAMALGIAGVGAVYSVPRFNWKGRPFLSSLAHLAGGLLHFLLGYSLGGHALDRRGLVIGSFFAVTFAAGHLTQEVRDYAGDLRNAIRTNAVVFGPRRTFAASIALFTLSQGLLLLLAVQGTLPRPLVLLALFWPLHLRWSRQALNDGLTYASVCRLQTRYRVLYAGFGAAVAAALWLA